ncbi:MAG: hypothetical protein V4726_19230 [Verrucomicrobiota bacterium]
MKYYYPHITFFIVFLVAAVPILYYYQRKNPHPRFRPSFGEMTMVSIFALVICGGLSFGLGSLFKPENDGTAMKKKADEGAGWSAGSQSSMEKEGSRDRRKSKEPTDLSGAGFKHE